MVLSTSVGSLSLSVCLSVCLSVYHTPGIVYSVCSLAFIVVMPTTTVKTPFRTACCILMFPWWNHHLTKIKCALCVWLSVCLCGCVCGCVCVCVCVDKYYNQWRKSGGTQGGSCRLGCPSSEKLNFWLEMWRVFVHCERYVLSASLPEKCLKSWIFRLWFGGRWKCTFGK